MFTILASNDPKIRNGNASIKILSEIVIKSCSLLGMSIKFDELARVRSPKMKLASTPKKSAEVSFGLTVSIELGVCMGKSSLS